jgi:acyl dehydratase
MGLTNVSVGTTLPPLVLPPLTRASLALYAGGSGDHIPLHIDSDFARAAGHPDVFMHGMLGAALLARHLTDWMPQECLCEFRVRFVAITWPGEVLTASGTIVEVDAAGRLRVAIALDNADGVRKIVGDALVDPARAADRRCA